MAETNTNLISNHPPIIKKKSCKTSLTGEGGQTSPALIHTYLESNNLRVERTLRLSHMPPQILLGKGGICTNMLKKILMHTNQGKIGGRRGEQFMGMLSRGRDLG